MGGASSWYAMLYIAIFFLSVWLAGKLAKLIGMSSIIFEVAVGLVLGPNVLSFLPEVYSKSLHQQKMDCGVTGLKDQLKVAEYGAAYCDLDAYLKKNLYNGVLGDEGSDRFKEFYDKVYKADDTHRRLAGGNAKGKTKWDSYDICLERECELKKAISTATTPDMFTLAGHIGVAMMIFESGMHFDFEQARTVGPWASLVALLGTFLPLLSGTALAYGYGFKLFPDSMCAGVALAPTSVGIALKLLHEAGALSHYFGQAVMTAAFVDDVLSLVIFSVLFTAAGGDVTFMAFLPLILGCVFMALAIPAAVTVWPKLLQWIFQVVPETKPDAKITRHNEVLFVVMFFTLCVYGLITHLCGTHLWGCFIAGMSFAPCHEAHHVWVKQVKRNTCWFLRIFFACTLAWSIPVDALLSFEAFWMGSLMGIGPCIATKVLCGPFMGPSRWVIGWAMVGRAEFAYFIAIFAKSLKLMDDKLFAILIWALLYATIFAPVIFRAVLKRYMIASGLVDVNSPPVSPTRHLEHRASGHLPDIYAEKLEKEEMEMRKNAQLYDELYEEAQKEIARLKQLLDEKNGSTEKGDDKEQKVGNSDAGGENA